MRHRVSNSSPPGFAGEQLLPHSWKGERLLGLPDRELRSWYENMEAGLDLARDELELTYKLGDMFFSFHLSPKKLLLPDGSTVFVKSRGRVEESFLENPSPVELITSYLTSRVRNIDVPLVQEFARERHGLLIPGVECFGGEESKPRMVTERQLLTELIAEQFRSIEAGGVERAGFFVEGLSGLQHMRNPVGSHIVFTDLTRYAIMPDGGRMPQMILQSNVDKMDPQMIYCFYHTHWGSSGTQPSWFDLEKVCDRGEDNILIASRREPRDEKGSYLVTEWRPKAGVELRDELPGCLNRERGGEKYDPKAVERLIEGRLEKRDCVLAEDDSRMRLRPLG